MNTNANQNKGVRHHRPPKRKKEEKKRRRRDSVASSKTYNTGDSQIVTDSSTNPALLSLYMGERTGSLAV